MTIHEHPPRAREDFWAKFGSDAPQSFEGLRVIEIGCGEGVRALELARQGAIVTGIDIDDRLIGLAEQRKKQAEPELQRRVTFRLCPLQQVESGSFDVALSEDAFEHIIDVPEVLAAIRDKLAVGGRAYIGFGPLYHSPYGDHGWIRNNLPYGALPWSHLFLPKAITYKMVAKRIGQPFKDTVEWPFLALNQYTVRDFERMFAESGLRIVSIRNIEHASLAGKVFDALAKLPVLRRYFTDGIYCVLEKR
jgi:SAM-dependent methyltransferase